MLSLGVDAGKEQHVVKIQNDEERILWKGTVRNNRQSYEELVAKICQIETSQNDRIIAVLVEPTGNYHLCLCFFLEEHGYKIKIVNPIVAKAARQMENRGRIKEDARRGNRIEEIL
jgi:transposase